MTDGKITRNEHPQHKERPLAKPALVAKFRPFTSSDGGSTGTRLSWDAWPRRAPGTSLQSWYT
jgi:hypothetical protein